ncbi:PTS sugar transporter subunit IIC/EAL domain-containing protein [Maridesulfovibrio sp. FT414]|uniref:PTS sugar transporter subunit IIC/EAL domain-containing protein n=1 Tax=Maridesulfovibrio sp. FT414 TaxID=2979469 RepID=UPI003D80798E
MVEDKVFSGIGYINAQLEKVGGLFFFKAMRQALLLVFPLTIVGATALCALNFPVLAVQDVMVGKIREVLQVVVDGTLGIAALAMLASMSYCLGNMYNREDEISRIHPFLYSIIASGCFFVLTGSGDISSFTELTSISNSVLEAVFTASVSSWMLHGIVKKRFRLSVAGTGYDLFSMEVFSIVPACMLVLGFFTLLRVTVDFIGFDSFQDMTGWIVMAMFSPVKNEFISGALYTLFSQLLWFFGAHGPNVLHAFHSDVLYPNMIANMAAQSAGAPEHILTQGFLDAFTMAGGSGFTFALVIAIIVGSRNLRSRQFSKLALFVSLFNINEPLLFGIPLILNPIYFIPFVFGPVVLYMVAYAVCASGLVSVVTWSFNWTIPVFLSGYTATGDWTGVALQVFLLGLGVLIYLPFVRLSERMQSVQFKENMNTLIRTVRSGVTARKCRCITLPGINGFTARSLGKDLLVALRRNDQLYLVFQPQVDVADRTIIGAEALLRWNHPRYGFISPEIIIALAEDLECIEELSYFVLREACRHMEHWSESMEHCPYVSVNFTPSLITEGMAEKVYRVLRESGISPECLEIEITEAEAVTTRKSTIDRLNALRSYGIRIAIDDFGMGHTSLRYLREMPVDKVKIDRSLTLESEKGVNRHIVFSILELCRKIDLKVIIEGVETAEQLEEFISMGAFSFQGYYFSRPLPAEDCFTFMKNWTAASGSNEPGDRRAFVIARSGFVRT